MLLYGQTPVQIFGPQFGILDSEGFRTEFGLRLVNKKRRLEGRIIRHRVVKSKVILEHIEDSL